MKRLSFFCFGALFALIIGLMMSMPLSAFAAESASTKKPFLMPVEDVFTITGRGTVVTGRVERGDLTVGHDLELVGMLETPEKLKVTVVAIESHGAMPTTAKAGDSIGVVLRGNGMVLDPTLVKRGQVLAKVGSIKPKKQFKAKVDILPTEKGGRKLTSGARPMVYLRTMDVSGVLTLPAALQELQPGTSALVTIDLQQPVGLEKGQTFALREYGRTIGSGVVE